MKKILIFVLCVFVQGCVTPSTTLKLNPQALTGQKEVSQSGVNAVVSEKKVRVTVSPLKDTCSPEDYLTFVVSVYSTDESFDFSTNNIQAFVDSNSHKVLTYDELVADLNEQKKALIRKAELKKDAKYQAAAGNGAIQNRANREMFEEIDEIEKNISKSIKNFNSNTLRRIRVTPDKQYSGYITIDKISKPSKSKEIKLVVTTAGEKHEFLINLAII